MQLHICKGLSALFRGSLFYSCVAPQFWPCPALFVRRDARNTSYSFVSSFSAFPSSGKLPYRAVFAWFCYSSTWLWCPLEPLDEAFRQSWLFDLRLGADSETLYPIGAKMSAGVQFSFRSGVYCFCCKFYNPCLRVLAIIFQCNVCS